MSFFQQGNFGVLRQFTRREFRLKYQGTMLGRRWIFIQPLLLLSLFTFVFSDIFHMRWPNQPKDSPLYFSVFMFAGLTLHQTVSEVLSRAPSVFVSQASLVTKVVFPLWVLPVSMALGALYHFLLSLLVYLALLASLGFLSVHWLILPVVLFPFLLSCCSLSLLFASLGIFLRDLGPIIGLFVTGLMFLTPIFYPLASVSDKAAFWLRLNPMTPLVESFRAILFSTHWPSSANLIYIWLTSLGILLFSVWVYRRLKTGFADVL